MSVQGQLGRLACITALACAAAASQSLPMDEYRVKAGFLSGFASFIEWPQEVFRTPQDPVSICILGRNPFGSALDEFIAGKIVQEHPVNARQILDAREAEGCHIIFISASEHLRLKSILNSLRTECILTIGDTSDFIAEGGLVNLRLESGKVRIDLNADAAKDHHLRISSRLLQLARNVKR